MPLAGRAERVELPLYPNSSAPRRKDFVIEKPTIGAENCHVRRFLHILVQNTQITQSLMFTLRSRE
jgi:hypothetical protein